MKKIRILLLAVALTVATTLALSSCDALISRLLPEDPPPDNVGNPGDTDTENDKNGDKNSDGDTDTENDKNGDDNSDDENPAEPPAVRTTVTEEEWEANMNITNYSVYHKTLLATKNEDGTVQTYVGSYHIHNVNQDAVFSRWKDFGAKEEESFYYVLQNDSWYRVEWSNGEYVGIINNYSNDSSLKYLTENFNILGLSDVEYDEEKQAYTSYTVVNNIPLNTYLYFENGNIVKAEIIFANEVDVGTTYGYGYIVEYSDIGTTVVYVPEFTVKE